MVWLERIQAEFLDILGHLHERLVHIGALLGRHIKVVETAVFCKLFGCAFFHHTLVRQVCLVSQDDLTKTTRLETRLKRANRYLHDR